MKKLKKHAALLILAILLVVGVPVGTTLAIVLSHTEAVVNTFDPAEVDCEVDEEFSGDTKTSVKIKNTGNVDAFLRIRVLSYWVDSKGNIVAQPADHPAINYDSENWIYDLGNRTYYCKTPIASKTLTPELLTQPITLFKTKVVPDPEKEPDAAVTFTYHHVVEFVAEAIQAEPANAAAQSWGVTVSGGVITSP